MSHHQNQRQQFNMVGGGNYSNNYGGRYHHDTTYTKIFVGGLAWETQRDTMKQYFEQFGEILEAVVISDKTSGRSKGYGFVTFREPQAAYRACENPSPVIDGRRANCNLASLGAQKNRSPTPQHVAGGGRFRGSPGLMNVPAYATSPSSSPYFQPAASAQPPPFPYSSYGFTGYAHDTMYPMNYYGGVYGQQFSPYYLPSPTTGAGVGSSSTQGSIGYFHNFYPYYPSYPQPQGTSHGPSTYGVQYPPMVQQYPLLTHQPNSSSAGILTLPTSTTIATPTPSTTTTAATTIASTATTIASTTTTTVNASGVGSTSIVGVVVSAGSGDSDDVKTGATSEQN